MIIAKPYNYTTFEDITDWVPGKGEFGDALINPYYAHVCDNTSGEGRIPLPVALLQENPQGVEARAFFSRWLKTAEDAGSRRFCLESFWHHPEADEYFGKHPHEEA